jgi:hypothetical protein
VRTEERVPTVEVHITTAMYAAAHKTRPTALEFVLLVHSSVALHSFARYELKKM